VRISLQNPSLLPSPSRPPPPPPAAPALAAPFATSHPVPPSASLRPHGAVTQPLPSLLSPLPPYSPKGPADALPPGPPGSEELRRQWQRQQQEQQLRALSASIPVGLRASPTGGAAAASPRPKKSILHQYRPPSGGSNVADAPPTSRSSLHSQSRSFSRASTRSRTPARLVARQSLHCPRCGSPVLTCAGTASSSAVSRRKSRSPGPLSGPSHRRHALSPRLCHTLRRDATPLMVSPGHRGHARHASSPPHPSVGLATRRPATRAAIPTYALSVDTRGRPHSNERVVSSPPPGRPRTVRRSSAIVAPNRRRSPIGGTFSRAARTLQFVPVGRTGTAPAQRVGVLMRSPASSHPQPAMTRRSSRRRAIGAELVRRRRNGSATIGADQNGSSNAPTQRQTNMKQSQGNLHTRGSTDVRPSEPTQRQPNEVLVRWASPTALLASSSQPLDTKVPSSATSSIPISRPPPPRPPEATYPGASSTDPTVGGMAEFSVAAPAITSSTTTAFGCWCGTADPRSQPLPDSQGWATAGLERPAPAVPPPQAPARVVLAAATGDGMTAVAPAAEASVAAAAASRSAGLIEELRTTSQQLSERLARLEAAIIQGHFLPKREPEMGEFA